MENKDYKYSGIELNELLGDADIDPEDCDVLYAVSQCYKYGYGTEINMEYYRQYLEASAENGSEIAGQELETLKNEEAVKMKEKLQQTMESESAATKLIDEKSLEDALGQQLKVDYIEMTIRELMKRSEQNDPSAMYEMYVRYMETGEDEKAKIYLEKAREQIDNINTKEEIIELSKRMTMNMNDKDLDSERKLLEKSVELGDVDSAVKLLEFYRMKDICSEFYREEVDGKVEREAVDKYQEMVLKNGTISQIYRSGIGAFKSGDKMSGCMCMEEIYYNEQATSLEKAKAKLQLIVNKGIKIDNREEEINKLLELVKTEGTIEEYEEMLSVVEK